MMQLAPGARVPQLLVSVNCPSVFTDLSDVEVVNGFVTVTVPEAPSKMTSDVVESVTSAALPLTDVDRLAAPLSVNFTDPLRNPPVVGWKATVARQLCPAARVDVTDVTVSGANPILLSIVVSVGLATPTSSVGKVKLGGETADTPTRFVSGCVTTACGRLKFPTPFPDVPRTI